MDDTGAPAQLRDRLFRLRHDRETQRLFIVYALIGGGVQLLDIAVFQALLWSRFAPVLAVTGGGAAALFAHFSLNRYANFRNFDRSAFHQFRTYLMTTAVWWVVTVSIVQISIYGLHLLPLYGKLIAVVVNFPLNFLAQRYLTFGPGIRAQLKSWLRRRGASIALRTLRGSSEEPPASQGEGL